MTKKITSSKAFDKDVKRVKKQGKRISKLWGVIEKPASGQDLEGKHRPHRLGGDWKDWWECHIEPDWLLIYDYSETELLLARTGSHSELF